jgi:hypothetical protein
MVRARLSGYRRSLLKYLLWRMHGEHSMKQQWPAEENQPDDDTRAEEQRANFEPDELDGPAADLDRTLDDENPQPNS